MPLPQRLALRVIVNKVKFCKNILFIYGFTFSTSRFDYLILIKSS